MTKRGIQNNLGICPKEEHQSTRNTSMPLLEICILATVFAPSLGTNSNNFCDSKLDIRFFNEGMTKKDKSVCEMESLMRLEFETL